MPQAQTNTTALHSGNTSAVFCARFANGSAPSAGYLSKQNSMTFQPSGNAFAMRFESSAPRRVTEKTAALMCSPSPCGIPWKIRCRRALKARSCHRGILRRLSARFCECHILRLFLRAYQRCSGRLFHPASLPCKLSRREYPWSNHRLSAARKAPPACPC